MKKKNLPIIFAVTAMAMLSACSNSTGNSIDTSTVPAIEETIFQDKNGTDKNGTETEPATEAVDSTEPYHDKEQISTAGTYKSSNTAEDVNGEYVQMTFTDEQGNDFIANISKDTTIPDEMVEGSLYEVLHSNIMTMSEPGIYPQVYSISPSGEEARTIISTSGTFVSSETASDNTDARYHYTFTDETGNDFIALVTVDTRIPDNMKTGHTYTVSHSGIMTRSMPGMYTEVFDITEND